MRGGEAVAGPQAPARAAWAVLVPSTRGATAGPVALLGAVLVYLAVVLVAPMVALVLATGEVGFGAALAAATAPGALEALRMSLAVVAIGVAVNAVVGTLGAIALVRHRF